MNPLTPLIAVPIVLAAVLFLLARPANAPGTAIRIPLADEIPHVASKTVTAQLQGAYPETVAALARKWSKVFKVPVSWIRSQAWAESRNVPTARNEVTGAAGVLQILPVTAEWLIKGLRKIKNRQVQETLRIGWHGEENDLFNPDVNVMLAAYYLLLLKKKFGDDHDVVAAAYNAGPNKIAKIIATGGSLPPSSRTYLAMVADAKRRGFT